MNDNKHLASDSLQSEIRKISVEIAQELSSLKELVKGVLLHIEEQGSLGGEHP